MSDTFLEIDLTVKPELIDHNGHMKKFRVPGTDLFDYWQMLMEFRQHRGNA